MPLSESDGDLNHWNEPRDLSFVRAEDGEPKALIRIFAGDFESLRACARLWCVLLESGVGSNEVD